MTPFVVFLQNAWSPLYGGGEWPRQSWLKALAGSRSGTRLTWLLGIQKVGFAQHPELFEPCENTTPICGDSPRSIVPPDFKHISEVLCRRRPQVVVACGKQAEKALASAWEGYMLAVPHPAARLLTNDLYQTANEMLRAGVRSRWAIRMKPDCHIVEKLKTK